MAGIRIAVRVSPGGTRSRWMGRMADGRLKVRVGAPPEDGRANRELVRFVADSLGVPQRAVRLVSGATARDKVLECDADPERIRQLTQSGGAEGPPDSVRREARGGKRKGTRRASP